MKLRSWCLVFLGTWAISKGFGQKDTLAWWALNEKEGNFIQEKVTGTNFTLISPYAPLETKPGVKNTAIQLNGYATWLEGELPIALPAQGFTLSLWVAVKSYPVNTTAFYSNYDDASKKGFFVGLDRFGRPVLSINFDGVPLSLLSVPPIPQGEWSHLVLVVDAGSVYFYVNGERVITYAATGGNLQFPNQNTIKIGKFPTSNLVGIFETNAFNGSIDEVLIRAARLSSSEVKSLYQSFLPIKPADLSIPASRFQQPAWRPIFHPIPETAWTNEPHGLIWHNGKYHMFFQKNASGPFWSQINWGHLSSTNLLNWTEERPILYPELGYDQAGIWSGTCMMDNQGVPTILYTGVDGATAQMCLATGNQDLSFWKKFTGNPVVEAPPAPYTGQDFRDPFLWKQDNTWYMIIGSGLGTQSSSGGAALLYKGANLSDWTYVGVLHKSTPLQDDAGVFWEMPIFVKFGEKYLLLVNPVPVANKPARAIYWTGKFINERFVPDYTVPKKLEILNALLSPTVAKDENGEHTAIGIVPDDLSPEGQREKAWAHLYSMARLWTLSSDGKTLLQAPHPAYQKLRTSHQRIENLEISNTQKSLSPGIRGRNLELQATIDPLTAQRVGFVIAKTADGTEQTRILYETTSKSILLDRTKSSINPYATKDLKSEAYPLPNNQSFELHIFIDGSIVEVFVNDQAAFAFRIFPENAESVDVDVFVQSGKANFVSIDAWQMKSGKDATVGLLEPKFFPHNAIKKTFPNPVNEFLNVEFDLPAQSKATFLEINNVLGQKLKTQKLQDAFPGIQTHSIAIGDLPNGVFFMSLRVNGNILGSSTFTKN